MDIISLGLSSFKLSTKKVSIVIDPFDPKMVGLKFPKVEADIVTVSHNHADHNRVDLVIGARKVIDGPGEYEIEEVSIIGIPSFHDNSSGSERGKNIIFVFEIEGLRLAHLGDLGHKLTEDQVESIGNLDVLMIPVGGTYTIGPEEAVEVSQIIEPKIVIPMHFKTEGLGETFSSLVSADGFIKNLGLRVETMAKLSIKEGSTPEEQMIVMLAPR